MAVETECTRLLQQACAEVLGDLERRLLVGRLGLAKGSSRSLAALAQVEGIGEEDAQAALCRAIWKVGEAARQQIPSGGQGGGACAGVLLLVNDAVQPIMPVGYEQRLARFAQSALPRASVGAVADLVRGLFFMSKERRAIWPFPAPPGGGDMPGPGAGGMIGSLYQLGAVQARADVDAVRRFIDASFQHGGLSRSDIVFLDLDFPKALPKAFVYWSTVFRFQAMQGDREARLAFILGYLEAHFPYLCGFPEGTRFALPLEAVARLVDALEAERRGSPTQPGNEER